MSSKAKTAIFTDYRGRIVMACILILHNEGLSEKTLPGVRELTEVSGLHILKFFIGLELPDVEIKVVSDSLLTSRSSSATKGGGRYHRTGSSHTIWATATPGSTDTISKLSKRNIYNQRMAQIAQQRRKH
ncbi:hypothetical protein J6590_058104 [Homalodisca vitripennis]|nr:hypothetical protein J6590_058104 [Homalodisca vitripennis]